MCTWVLRTRVASCTDTTTHINTHKGTQTLTHTQADTHPAWNLALQLTNPAVKVRLTPQVSPLNNRQTMKASGQKQLEGLLWPTGGKKRVTRSEEMNGAIALTDRWEKGVARPGWLKLVPWNADGQRGPNGHDWLESGPLIEVGFLKSDGLRAPHSHN